MQCLICALTCEAASLIEHFSLKPLSNELPFKIYTGEKMKLIVTGIGKVQAGAACGYLFGMTPTENGIWLNIGVAGGHYPVGTAFLAHKILGKRSFYPSFSFPLPCATAPLITEDYPAAELKEEHLYDMEAAGFYEIARRFTSLELVHAFKVVSDQGTQWLEKKDISALIDAQIPLIETILDQLSVLQSILQQPRIMRDDLSQTEQHQRKRLLQQCQSLGIPTDSKNPKQLKAQLNAHVPTYLR